MFATYRPVTGFHVSQNRGTVSHGPVHSSVPGAGAGGLTGDLEGAVGLDLGRGCPV